MFAVIPLMAFLIFALYAFVSIEKPARLYIDRNPLSIVFWLYILSAFCALFLNQEDFPSFRFRAYDVFYSLTYAFFVIIFLIPAASLRGYVFGSFDFKLTPGVHGVFILAAISAIFAALYQLPYVFVSLATGAYAVRKDLNVEGLSILPDSPLTTLAVGFSSFYLVYMILFYVAVLKKMGFLIQFALFLGGALYLISSLTFAARDGVVFYIFSMVFFYRIFADQLSDYQRRVILRGASLLSCLAAVLLIAFTTQRFTGIDRESDLVGGTISYVGQQVFVFSETIVAQEQFYGLHLRFPFFQEIIFGGLKEIVRTSPYEWSFGTFLKDFYAVSGWSSLLVLSSFFSLFFFLILRIGKGFHPLVFLLVVTFYFQFMTSGLFYYRLGTYAGNQYTVIYWMLVILVHFYLRRQRLRQ